MGKPGTLVVAMTPGILVPYKTAAKAPPFELVSGQQAIVKRYAPCDHAVGHCTIEGSAGTGKTATAVALATTRVPGVSERCVCVTVTELLGGTSAATFRPSRAPKLGSFTGCPTDIRRIVFEEAWMIPGVVFDTISEWLSVARGERHHPFGGVPQIVLVGDWLLGHRQLVDDPLIGSGVYKTLRPTRHTLDLQMRFNAVEEDDYAALLALFHDAVTGDSDTRRLPSPLDEFQDRVLYGTHKKTRVDTITVGPYTSSSRAAQWKLCDERGYPSRFPVCAFGPAGIIAGSDVRKAEGCFPVAEGCPIRFTRDVTQDDAVVAYRGEIGILVEVQGHPSEFSLGRPILPKRGVVVVVTLPCRHPEVGIKLRAPFLVAAAIEHASKKARNDPDGDMTARAAQQQVPSATWPFCTAWSLSVNDARGLTLPCKVTVDATPRLTDVRGMSLFYTGMTRVPTFLALKSNATSYTLTRPLGTVVAEAHDEEEV
jgi:hypothetical protein